MVRKVLRMGHPILRQKARPLALDELQTPKVRELISDMIETLRHVGGIGLAAPQIGESVQLAIIEITPENRRYPNMRPIPLSVFINPKIQVLDSTEQAFWEGCLSVPDLRGLVHRPRKIQINYLDESGKLKQDEAEDFLATVFQHEFDHLEGSLFIDRIKDTRNLAFLDEYREFWLSPPAPPQS